MSIDKKTALDAVRHMQDRQSVRNFSNKPIPQEDLDEILLAAVTCATAGNLQPVSIIVEKDPERNKQLGVLCTNQPFIGKAPVNLLFILDWHKLSVYARERNAPFNCNNSWMHFVTGLEDVMCAAQSAETAAHLLGIGSCYIGTTMHSGSEISEMYNLPPKTYPMVLLSLGYAKDLPAKRKKLDHKYMIFEGMYPDIDKEDLCRAYDEKYEGLTLSFPSNPDARLQMVNKLRRGLLTSYNPEEAEKIISDALELGYITEIQRRFGIHYHAVDNYNKGGHILEMMKEQDMYPTQILEEGKIEL
ncbi:MAG: nitroreductase family protein [Clostridiaceae bacterium]|nr:nitroreductase family protein [Clostridiaceae bacterium]